MKFNYERGIGSKRMPPPTRTTEEIKAIGNFLAAKSMTITPKEVQEASKRLSQLAKELR